eukprot:1141857-Pelagomonas_calceolata.AAC.4
MPSVGTEYLREGSEYKSQCRDGRRAGAGAEGCKEPGHLRSLGWERLGREGGNHLSNLSNWTPEQLGTCRAKWTPEPP